MSRTRVSIVIPSHNTGRFLSRLSLGLTNQTIGIDVCEIIVIDNGSTDNTMEQLDHLAALPSAGIQVVELEHTDQTATIYNKGCRQATAPYVVCLDPKDLPAPEWLAACVATLEELPEAGLAYTHFVQSEKGHSQRNKLPSFSREKLARHNIVSPAPVMRRSVFEDSQGYRGNTTYMNWDFCIQAACNGYDLSRIDATYYSRMVEGDSPKPLSQEEDTLAKASVVLNNPTFFSSQTAQWAMAAMEKKPWAFALPTGVIPNASAVENLLKTQKTI